MESMRWLYLENGETETVTATALRVAGDYLKEHWHPNQEPPGALCYLTDVINAERADQSADPWLMQFLPHYQFGDDDDLLDYPLFTDLMLKTLEEVGVRLGKLGTSTIAVNRCRLHNWGMS